MRVIQIIAYKCIDCSYLLKLFWFEVLYLIGNQI